MKNLPKTENPLLIRTDFSADSIWDQICAALREPAGELGFIANLDVITDPDYEGMSVAQLLASMPAEGRHAFAALVDTGTITSPEHAILIVDLSEDLGRTFRAVSSALWAVENNLSTANMDFDEFLAQLGPDRIFRL